MGKKIRHFYIMFEDIPVLEYNREEDKVVVLNNKFLPFAFRNKKRILGADIIDWLNERIDNINRTYMNKVYIARNIGRDKSNIIKDSLGISFTDNFWIKTNDISVDWKTLKELRDKNTDLNEVAITGNIDFSKDLKKGFTTLFTTKGCFPKYANYGYLIKRKEDAILEVAAEKIGKYIGINISDCTVKDNLVFIKLFTNDTVSLVHASELHDFFNSDDEIYNIILNKLNRPDILNDMQKMFIFNYIIGNPDLHEDNYGLLYNTSNFEFIGLAPCFDHNVAFQLGFFGDSRVRMLGNSILPLDILAKQFIKRHADIVNKLKQFDIYSLLDYLSYEQVDELKFRIKNVIDWYNK